MVVGVPLDRDFSIESYEELRDVRSINFLAFMAFGFYGGRLLLLTIAGFMQRVERRGESVYYGSERR
jgi:hypothetical protein